MTATSATSERAGPYTYADLEAMPDDGRRRELIDGVLIVSPSPVFRHQIILGGVHRTLASTCPAELCVLLAPFDVVLAEDTVLQPDLLVARRSDFTERNLPVAPLLAVEILSPSTRRVDLTVKRTRFEAAGCPSYWVVDPDGPSVTAWELQNGSYVLAAEASGDSAFAIEQPYPVEFRPADLTN